MHRTHHILSHVWQPQLSITLWAHRTYHILSHVWHTNYPPHYGHTKITIFHHLSGTPTIHHITGTQNILYFITCLAHQLSTTFRAHRTYHILSHVWHINYPPCNWYIEHTIFIICVINHLSTRSWMHGICHIRPCPIYFGMVRQGSGCG